MADRLLRVLPLPPLTLPPIRPVEFAQRGVCDQRAIAPGTLSAQLPRLDVARLHRHVTVSKTRKAPATRVHPGGRNRVRKTARRRLFQQADDAIVARYKPSNCESAWYCTSIRRCFIPACVAM